MKILDSQAQDPLDVRHNAHANSDHYFGQPTTEAFGQDGVFSDTYCLFRRLPMVIYNWLNINKDPYAETIFLLCISILPRLGSIIPFKLGITIFIRIPLRKSVTRAKMA